MKLLLTSAGISNESIKKALFDLVNKKPEETSLVFIPTASNVERGDKSWFINDLINLKNLNLKSISMVDISAVPESVWKSQIEESDILFFEGGNTFHLMEWINKSGLSKILPELLKTKVYVGVSAGSMVACPNLLLNTCQSLYKEEAERTENMDGLNFVDFYVLPHYNSSSFSKRNEGIIRDTVKDMSSKIYALDDMSALKVIDNEVSIVTEGEYLEIN